MKFPGKNALCIFCWNMDLAESHEIMRKTLGCYPVNITSLNNSECQKLESRWASLVCLCNLKPLQLR